MGGPTSLIWHGTLHIVSHQERQWSIEGQQRASVRDASLRDHPDRTGRDPMKLPFPWFTERLSAANEIS